MKLSEAYKEEQLENIRRLYRAAFPANERKPFNLILRKRFEGSAEIMAIENGSEFIGLAITVLHKDLVLLDYFAISEEKRGSGAGTEALALIKLKYEGKRLFLEIETTLGSFADMADRQRRKAFYQKNGLAIQPYMVKLFGVDMEIMTASGEVSFEDYHSLYTSVFGKKAARNVRLL